MGRSARAFGLLGAFLLLGPAGCGPAEQRDVTGVVRDGRTGEALSDAVVRGSRGVETRSDDTGRFTLPLPVGSDRVVRAAQAQRCPGETRVDVTRDGAADVTVHLFPRVELEEEFLQVGFDQEVRIEATLRCDPEAVLRWSQATGPELAPERFVVEDGGRLVRLRTLPLADLVALEDRLVVVSLSRAQRAEYRLAMETELGHGLEQRTVRVTAAGTTAGVFQVPTGADMYLDGGSFESHGWELLSKPEQSSAELIDADTRTPHFRPDRFGQYMVRHVPRGLDINIQAGPYDEVPRDCGREGCHRPEDRGWQATAHARTLRRGLSGELGEDFDERCWSCHANGVDPGVGNGSLLQVARRLQWSQPEPAGDLWEQAPRAVRRFGSVWCSACHGPGRILPPPFHWEYGAKYRASVCARCHDAVDDPDAPHDSWQQREWRAAPMATPVISAAEGEPALRRRCASCHSAQGFVAFTRRGEHIVPDAGSVEVVTCQACHDPHDGTRPRALRAYEDVDDVAGVPARGLGTGAVCVLCHRTGIAREGMDSAAPHAPQGDVLLGRGSHVIHGRMIGAHSQLANTCVACHMARPGADDPFLGRAGGHTFSVRDLATVRPRAVVSPTACASCHGIDVPPQAIGGIRDWNGDGRADNVGEEFDRSLTAALQELRQRITFARVHDECETPTLARDWVERDALLVLTDGQGRLLGDCDGDGAIGRREHVVGVEQISREVRAMIWDVSMLDKDGSRGRHNPAFAFTILREVLRALR